MGRLSKAKIDQIAKLRNEGLLQREVAEELRINIKTVGKYDPLKEETAPDEGTSNDRRPGSLEERVRRLEDWLWMIGLNEPTSAATAALSAASKASQGERLSVAGWEYVNPSGKWCPRCYFELIEKPETLGEQDDFPTLDQSARCSRCGSRFSPPLNPWQRSPGRPTSRGWR